MAPSEALQRSVMIVCREIAGSMVEVGTAFLVSTPATERGVARYFVTAKHVVAHGQPVCIRLRRCDGGNPHDQLMGEWVQHPTADVAMIPCDFDTDVFIATHQEEEVWSDQFPPGRPPRVGDRAYFMGLLGDVPTMARRAVPVMRSASVAALYADEIPVRHRISGSDRYETHYEPQAHLIDTYSRSGFSGAPVYVEHAFVMVQDFPDQDLRVTDVRGVTPLLGVLAGHFGIGDKNTGIAIVVPVNALRDLLADSRMIEFRDREAARMQKRHEDAEFENAAVQDVMTEPARSSDRVSLEGVSPEDALRALLRTPPSGRTQDPA